MPAVTLRPARPDDAGRGGRDPVRRRRDGHLGHVPNALVAVRVADTTVAEDRSVKGVHVEAGG